MRIKTDKSTRKNVSNIKKMHTHMYQLITLHKKLCSAEVTWRSAESTALLFGRACPAL